jgi:protocatechuate 3,4-dioxygenase beta subunit
MKNPNKYILFFLVFLYCLTLSAFSSQFPSQALAQTGSIAGKVTDSATKAGIADVSVEVYDVNIKNSPISSAATDANGNYTVAGLPSGSYKVKFESSSTGYISEWNLDRTNFCDADAVALTAPNTRTINAALNTGASITGTVTGTDSDGQGLADVIVEIYDPNNNLISSVSTYTDGNYIVKGLPSGSYKVRFVGSGIGYVNKWYTNWTDFCDADAIALTAPNIKTINAVLTAVVSSSTTTIDATTTTTTIAPAASSISKTVTNEANETPNINAASTTGGSITGKVIDPEGDGIKGINVDLVDQTTEGLVYQTKTTDDNGGYNLTEINKGSYKLRFYAKGYLGKWYINETEFKNADLVIVNDQEVTTVFDVVLTKLGSISGRVTGANGAGLTGLIEIFNLDYQSVAKTNTDGCGYYKFEDLQSGSYKVVFYTLCEEAWYNNKRDFESANAVTVAAPNETKGINIAYPAALVATTTTTVQPTTTTTVPPTTTVITTTSTIATTSTITTTTTAPPVTSTTTTTEPPCTLIVDKGFLPLRSGFFARLRRIVIRGTNSAWDRTSQVTIDDVITIFQRDRNAETIIAWIIIPGRLFANYEPGAKEVRVKTTGKGDCTGEILIE